MVRNMKKQGQVTGATHCKSLTRINVGHGLTLLALRDVKIWGIQMRNLLADELEIHHRIDLAQQMLLRHKHLDA